MEVICYATARNEAAQDSIGGIAHCHAVDPMWWVEMNIQMTKDNKLILFHDAEINLGGRVFRIDSLNLIDLKSFKIGDDEGIPLFETVLDQFPKSKFIFDIHSHPDQVVDLIINTIEKSRFEGQFIIASESDSIIQSLREKRPSWNYATPTKEAKRLAFSSLIGIERMFKMKSNYLIIPYFFNDRKIVSQRLLKLIKRRGKKIFLWMSETDKTKTVSTLKDFQLLKSLGVDGILTDSPEKLKSEISTHE